MGEAGGAGMVCTVNPTNCGAFNMSQDAKEVA